MSENIYSMSRLQRLDPKFKPAFDGPARARELICKLSSCEIVEVAYLFGSASEGKNTSDSDIDLLVVIPNSAKASEYYKVVGAPNFSAIAVDWIFKTRDEFERQLNEGGISRIAKLQGVRIFPNDSK